MSRIPNKSLKVLEGQELNAAMRLAQRVNLYDCNDPRVANMANRMRVSKLNEYQAVTELSRHLLPSGIERLMEIIEDKGTPPMAAIKGIELLWNYSYGKPHIREPHAQESKTPVIRVMFPPGYAPAPDQDAGITTEVIIPSQENHAQENQDYGDENEQSENDES